MAHRVGSPTYICPQHLAKVSSPQKKIWLSYQPILLHNHTHAHGQLQGLEIASGLAGCTLTLFHFRGSRRTLHRSRHPAVSPQNQLQGAWEVIVQTTSSRIVKPEEPSHHHHHACPCEFAIIRIGSLIDKHEPIRRWHARRSLPMPWRIVTWCGGALHLNAHTAAATPRHICLACALPTDAVPLMTRPEPMI